ncbi:hypothetical protein VTL71DRAFT_4911 [Oculimacula yallundae]|uniref:Vacuolar ATPase assembly protein VMA22 n=1 Tax=Oculimacula yallundae TaxID=86028 RepID=A0ABR4C3A0_9HELO
MAADSQALSDEIDVLLARYLQLLDEYTSARGTFSTLQSSIYTDIARANFQAERGVSYGRESYDRRAMRPGRLCRVRGDAEEGTAVFEIEKVVVSGKAGKDNSSPRDKEENEKGIITGQTLDIEESMERVTVQEGKESGSQDSVEDKEERQDTKASTETDSSPKPTPPQATQIPDPLRMFGFNIPSALRKAQTSSTQLTETSIPQLATITLQMRALEIQIRRTRKYRAKALAVEEGKGVLKGDVREGVTV